MLLGQRLAHRVLNIIEMLSVDWCIRHCTPTSRMHQLEKPLTTEEKWRLMESHQHRLRMVMVMQTQGTSRGEVSIFTYLIVRSSALFFYGSHLILMEDRQGPQLREGDHRRSLTVLRRLQAEVSGLKNAEISVFVYRNFCLNLHCLIEGSGRLQLAISSYSCTLLPRYCSCQ